jgi:hypothetical protein
MRYLFGDTDIAASTSSVSFRRHDVTVVPFPPGSCDVLYCRLLPARRDDPGRRGRRANETLRPDRHNTEGRACLKLVVSRRAATPFSGRPRPARLLRPQTCVPFFLEKQTNTPSGGV